MKRRWTCIGAALLLLVGCNLKVENAPTVTLSSPTDGTQMAVLQEDKAVTLAWTAEDAEGDPLTFDVYSGTTEAGMTKKATTSETEYSLSDLTQGTKYYWKIVASDGKNSADSETRSFTVGGQSAEIQVIEFTTGAMAAKVSVSVLQDETELISGTTDSNGIVKFYLPDSTFDIKATATGRATSVAYNYMPSKIPVLQMASNKAMTDYDAIPNVEVELRDSSSDIVIPIGTTITKQSVNVHVTSDERIDVLYLGLNFVPSALGRTAAWLMGTTDTTLTISLTGFTGKTVPLHIVAYTGNRTRVDKILYLPINYTSTEVTSKKAPTDLYIVGWTSDADVEYYRLVKSTKSVLSKNVPSSILQTTESLAPEHSINETNMLVQIAWTHAPSTDRAGYNVYRKEGAGDWEKIAFVNTYYCYDKGYGLNPGTTYYYRVNTLYVDGSESEGVESEAVVPLDLFKVKLASPANNATSVSRTPTFTWKPVVSNSVSTTPHIGGEGVPDSMIEYVYYGPWIYDTTVSDQHIFNDNYIASLGPAQESIVFLSGGNWTRIEPDGTYSVQTAQLEKMKTYEWGLDLAFAYYTSGTTTWISATIDLGYGYDRWTNEADYYNRFTTGK